MDLYIPSFHRPTSHLLYGDVIQCREKVKGSLDRQRFAPAVLSGSEAAQVDPVPSIHPKLLSMSSLCFQVC